MIPLFLKIDLKMMMYYNNKQPNQPTQTNPVNPIH
jgi:hypothetical protein